MKFLVVVTPPSIYQSTNNIMLQYRRIKSFFFTDTLLAQTTPSNRENKYVKIYVSEKGFIMYTWLSHIQYI